MTRFLDRVADAGGILHVLLAFGGFAVLVAPHLPPSLEAADVVVAHLRAHPPATGFWAGMWLEGAGLAVLVLLATRAAARLRSVQPDWWLPSAVVGMAVAAFAVKVASFAPGLAALEIDRFDAGTVTALLSVNDAAVGVARALDGAFVVLLGLGALAVGGLPRWLAAATVAVGVAVLAATAVPSLGLLDLLFYLWLPVLSGWLLLRGSRTVREPSTAG
ncbi:UNVERIFIED_ORG: hypothetical protein E4P37_00200 [Bacillus sp. AZ43]